MRQLPYEPNDQQLELTAAFCRFATESTDKSVFVLNGYAGTGKTSLTSAFVKALQRWGRKSVLLAPTGRAAKVFSSYSGHSAFTIHRRIYQSKKFDPESTRFGLARNNEKNTFFIVDEASMIANNSSEGVVFGTGCLLDDLIMYVYSGENCRLVLLGDVAQLPPVGYSESPALSANVLQGYGLTVYAYTLTEVARQRSESGILYNATAIRNIIASGRLEAPEIEARRFADIAVVSGDEIPDCIEECYDRDGQEETIVITRSNKAALQFNCGIRSRVLYMEEELCTGDMLLIAKNNYFWGQEYDNIDFIANGDVATISHIAGTTEMYGFRFADVTLYFPDYGVELETKIILDALYADTPSLSRQQNTDLFHRVLEDYADIPRKADRYKKLKANPYFNALQVKFAYSVTCHKAQGGQWKNVFIDMGYIPEEAYGNLDFYRWLYTAITRAYGKVYLINPPLKIK